MGGNDGLYLGACNGYRVDGEVGAVRSGIVFIGG